MSWVNRFCWYVSVIWTWSRPNSCSFSTELAADADSGAEMPPKSNRVSTRRHGCFVDMRLSPLGRGGTWSVQIRRWLGSILSEAGRICHEKSPPRQHLRAGRRTAPPGDKGGAGRENGGVATLAGRSR